MNCGGLYNNRRFVTGGIERDIIASCNSIQTYYGDKYEITLFTTRPFDGDKIDDDVFKNGINIIYSSVNIPNNYGDLKTTELGKFTRKFNDEFKQVICNINPDLLILHRLFRFTLNLKQPSLTLMHTFCGFNAYNNFIYFNSLCKNNYILPVSHKLYNEFMDLTVTKKEFIEKCVKNEIMCQVDYDHFLPQFKYFPSEYVKYADSPQTEYTDSVALICRISSEKNIVNSLKYIMEKTKFDFHLFTSFIFSCDIKIKDKIYKLQDKYKDRIKIYADVKRSDMFDLLKNKIKPKYALIESVFETRNVVALEFNSLGIPVIFPEHLPINEWSESNISFDKFNKDNIINEYFYNISDEDYYNICEKCYNDAKTFTAENKANIINDCIDYILSSAKKEDSVF